MKEKSRRQFLKGTIGTLGGTVLAKMAGLFPEARPLLARSTQEAIPVVRPPTHLDVGELYAGFLLLPNVDGLSNQLEGSTFNERKITEFDNLQEALNRTDIPLYLPKALPNRFEFSKVSFQEYQSETKPHLVTISYSSSGIENQNPAISMSASTDFPQPFPVRPVHVFQNNNSQPELVFPEKVSFSPAPGIMLPSVIGYGLHWIEDDVLYTVVYEHGLDYSATVKFVSALEKHS